MSRPAGVTVSAVFLILGSALIALTGVLMLFARLFIPPNTPEPPFAKAMMIFMGIVFFGAALWGVLTAVGLFRMRRWARISILVIGALLVIFCGLSLVMLLVLPLFMPELESTRGMGMVMGIVVTIYLIPIAFGIWWLVYFNRAAVKAAFLQGFVPEEGARRPLGITVIAWHAIVFGLCTAPFALTHWPAFLFGVVLTGWAARVVYLVFGVGQLAIGVGLLKLKPWSHTATVGLCLFAIVHAVVFALLPDKWHRMAEFIQYYPADMRRGFPVLPESFFWLGAVVTLALFAPVLWYLFTRKKAFLEAGKPPQVAV